MKLSYCLQKGDKEFKEGNRWLNSIVHGACVEILNSISPESFDLTVTSPPHSLREECPEFNAETIASALYRVMKPGGVIVWTVSDPIVGGSRTGDSFLQALTFKELGFLLHDTMIFQDERLTPFFEKTFYRYSSVFEFMFVFSKGRPKTAKLLCDKKNRWLGETNWGQSTKRLRDGQLVKRPDIKPIKKYSPRTNLWEYDVPRGIVEEVRPGIFPEQLAIDHILTWSNRNDVVVDPLCGTGTTCIAAARLGR